MTCGSPYILFETKHVTRTVKTANAIRNKDHEKESTDRRKEKKTGGTTTLVDTDTVADRNT